MAVRPPSITRASVERDIPSWNTLRSRGSGRQTLVRPQITDVAERCGRSVCRRLRDGRPFSRARVGASAGTRPDWLRRHTARPSN